MSNLRTYKRTDVQGAAENTNTEFRVSQTFSPELCSNAQDQDTYLPHQGSWQEYYTGDLCTFSTFSNTVAGRVFLNSALQNIMCSTMFVFKTYLKLLLLQNFN